MNTIAGNVPVMQSPPGPYAVIDGRRYCYFAGTGYLGLAANSEVIEAACNAIRQYGVHTATSRSGFGHNPLTHEVEKRAAEFFATEDAFYFSSGYVANHIMVQGLLDRVDAVFMDAASHYCLEEAARLTGKPVFRFQHRDVGDLSRQLEAELTASQRPLVLTDGVFSVSGRLAPLPEYLGLLERTCKSGVLHVDDAHGFGVLGTHGRGVVEHYGLWGADINHIQGGDGIALTVCGTLAKAMGGFGGIIPGSRSFLQQVRAASHYYEGASAPSSADAGASAKAIEIVQRHPELRVQLAANIARLRAGLRSIGLAAEDGPSANFAVAIDNAETMRRIHAELKAAGFIVPYIAAYSGIGPSGALRFAVCALHTSEMIDDLLNALQKLL